jgi:hypothetical protein
MTNRKDCNWLCKLEAKRELQIAIFTFPHFYNLRRIIQARKMAIHIGKLATDHTADGSLYSLWYLVVML